MENQVAMGNCALIATIKLFSAKWKPCILSHLMVGDRRYSEFLKIIPTITKKMLTAHLRELEKDGLVHREVFASVPPQVTYSITPKGKSIQEIFVSLSNWGVANLEDVVPMSVLISESDENVESNFN